MRKRRDLGLTEKLGDMTSMIDVVFLLLIFFILMPFKTSESRLESHLPKDSGPSNAQQINPPMEKIDIRIRLNDKIPLNTQNFDGVLVAINGKLIPNFVGLKSRLTELRSGMNIGDAAKMPVELNADENVPFYYVLKALDYAKLNHFTSIKFPKLHK